MAKLKIEINSIQSLKDLLQEIYNLANEQIIQSQNEINKMSNATILQEESIEGKAKYGKMINDYLSIKDKAISKKIDIAKILSDVCNKNGDISGALENNEAALKDMDFNFDDIKKMVDDSMEEKTKKKIELGKK